MVRLELGEGQGQVGSKYQHTRRRAANPNESTDAGVYDMESFMPLALIVLVGISVPQSSGQATATCVAVSVERALDTRPVFVGTVTEIRRSKPNGHATTITFRTALDRVYTSDVRQLQSSDGMVVLQQWADGRDSAYSSHFELGRTYLVFAASLARGTADAGAGATSRIDRRDVPPARATARSCEVWELNTPAGRAQLQAVEDALP